jgi:hypothetical protein
MTVLGAVFLPGFAPERLYDVVRAADAAGMDELWLWEDCFSESRIASAAPDPVPAPNPRPSHQSSAARGSIATQNCNGGSRAYGLGALRRVPQRRSQAREGTRNHQLNTASFNMGRLVAAGAIYEQEAADALIEQGQRIGRGATECERTVASGLSEGMEQPRGLGIG